MTDNIKSFEGNAKALNNSPMFNMSLGSRELFHSNFLAWLFERDNGIDYINEIFSPNAKVSGCYEVHREKLNIDLIIESKEGNWVIVIENKVKDTPKKPQLETYDGKLYAKYKNKNKKIYKYILTLVPPRDEIKTMKGWKVITYKELACHLGSITLTGDKSEIHKIFLDEYIENLNNIIAVVSNPIEQINDSNFWFLDKEKPKKNDSEESNSQEEKTYADYLSDIQFIDTYRKYQASSFFDKLEEAVKKKNSKLLNFTKRKYLDLIKNSSAEGNYFFIDYYHGLANKSPIAGMVITRKIANRKNNKNLYLGLGVQIQGTQYRRYIEFNGLNLAPKSSKSDGEKDNSGKIREFVAATDNYKWLFGKDESSDEFGKYYSSINKTNMFCCYAPYFAYQYITIGGGKEGSGKIQLGQNESGAKKGEFYTNNIINMFADDICKAYKLLNCNKYTKRYTDWSP